jgi:hypothetical protein
MKFRITSLNMLSAGIIASTALLSACGSDSNSTLVPTESKLIATVTQQQIDSAMTDMGIVAVTGLAACDVELHQVTYPSKGVDGEAVILSAALSIPSGPGCEGPFPILAKAHGTLTLATSSQSSIATAIFDQSVFASHGYIVVSPDYLGLGTSDYSYHPYLHRDSEAQSMVDAIRAARATISQLERGTELSGKVMLIGASQGGHAVMATQRLIDTHYSDEFNLVASGPIAGPYKLEETFLNGLNPDITNIAGGTLFSYAVQSYQNIYNNIYENVEDVFLPQYTHTVKTQFPGDRKVFDLILNGSFPNSVDQYVDPEFLADLTDNANNSLRIALRKNEVLDDFIPKTPMTMCGSSGDGTVPFFNTVKAKEYFDSVGATEVSVIDVAPMITVPLGADYGLTHHGRGNLFCFVTLKQHLFDPAK